MVCFSKHRKDGGTKTKTKRHDFLTKDKGPPRCSKMRNSGETHKLRDEEQFRNGVEDLTAFGQKDNSGGGCHSPKLCQCVCVIFSRMRCVTFFNLLFKGCLHPPPSPEPPSESPSLLLPTHSSTSLVGVCWLFPCSMRMLLVCVFVCVCVCTCTVSMCVFLPSNAHSVCLCVSKGHLSVYAHKKNVTVRQIMQPHVENKRSCSYKKSVTIFVVKKIPTCTMTLCKYHFFCVHDIKVS